MKLDDVNKQFWVKDLNLPSKRGYWIIKRTFDICFAVAVPLVLSPLLILIAILIKVDDPSGPVLYSQMRCGRGGKPFRMYKFRTMRPNADQLLAQLLAHNEANGPAFKMKHDPRITRFGRILRATNLDELPQIFNILRGDMSLVGPRPALPREVAEYDEYQYQRLFVTPGLTCYWQIADNRNDLSFEKWVDLDVKYVIERSPWVDLKIIMNTALAVLHHTGR